MTVGGFIDLADDWDKSSSAASWCVNIGCKFFSDGVNDVDLSIRPNILSLASQRIPNRVITSYSILYWFALEVCIIILCLQLLVIYKLFVSY